MNQDKKKMHESAQRLFKVAGVDAPMDLANLLNESPQTINNWMIRGVSKQGAINASQKIKHCDVNYILKGIGKAPDITYPLITKGNEHKVEDLLNKYHSNGVEIPLLAATGSMGNGNENQDADLVLDVLRVTRQWLDKTFSSISSINNLNFIHAIGDSMLPTFSDGDILLVDTGITNPTVDGIYVLDTHNRLFIKRVRRRIDGSFEISSDNPSVKTVDVLNGDHQVEIKGRVIWVWNGKKV